MLTRNNYETWFIDYHDGALNKTQVAELFAFLEKNTDLKAEFEFFNSVSLEPEEITFSGKESLKRSLIDQTNYLNWFVSYVENDLSESDRKLVEEFLKAHPELLKELELIIKTKSIPDYTIIFKDKSSLRKSAKVLTFSRTVYRSLSIAASIVLIAVAYYFIELRGKQKEEFAHQDQTEKSVAPSNTLPQGSEKELANQSGVEAPSSDPKNEEPKIVHPEKHRSAPAQNLAHNDQKIINPKKSDRPIEHPVPQPQIVNQLPANNQAPVPSPVNQSQQQFANQTQGANPTTQPMQILKPTAAELATVFSAEELKELGVQSVVVPIEVKPVSLPVIQYAAKEVKTLTQKSDISLKKDQNIVTDATTYALNIGKNFSVSHTSVK